VISRRIKDIENKLTITWKWIRNSGILIIIGLLLPFSFVVFNNGIAFNWIWGLGFIIGDFPAIISLLISPIHLIFSIPLFLIAVLSIITASLAKNYGNNKTISYRWIEFGILLIFLPLIYFLLQITELSVYLTIVEDSNIIMYFPINLFIFIIGGIIEIYNGYQIYRYS